MMETMKTPRYVRFPRALIAPVWHRCHGTFLLSLFTAFGWQAEAIAQTWSGGGTDDNWATGVNWGGTAAVAGNSPSFGGTTSLGPINNILADTLRDRTLNQSYPHKPLLRPPNRSGQRMPCPGHASDSILKQHLLSESETDAATWDLAQKASAVAPASNTFLL